MTFRKRSPVCIDIAVLFNCLFLFSSVFQLSDLQEESRNPSATISATTILAVTLGSVGAIVACFLALFLTTLWRSRQGSRRGSRHRESEQALGNTTDLDDTPMHERGPDTAPDLITEDVVSSSRVSSNSLFKKYCYTLS